MNNLELFDIYKNSNSGDDQLILDGLKDDNQKKIDSKFFMMNTDLIYLRK